MKHLNWLAVVGALVVAACGDDPVDVTGSYTVALTNRENGCNFQNWAVGDTTQGVGVDITQSADQASASVQGVAGGFLDLWLGGHVFSGTVDGNDVRLTIVGTRAGSMGACAFTYDAEITGTLTGDALQGNLRYKAKTNGAPDCGALTGCESRQEFSGARPPR